MLGASIIAVLLVGTWAFTRRESARWFRPAWMRLYSRLGKDDVLTNDARYELYSIIEKEPGIHVSELVRRVDGGWGGLMHHLQVLEDKDFVTSREDGRYRRLFPRGVYAPSRMEKISKLRNDSTAQALDIIARKPGINQTELAAALGMASPSARYHVERLEDAGLIRRERDGRSVRFYAQRVS